MRCNSLHCYFGNASTLARGAAAARPEILRLKPAFSCLAISPGPYAAAPTVVRSFLLKHLIRSDSWFDSWINFSVSEINRTIFLFSSSILPRNKAEVAPGYDRGGWEVLRSLCNRFLAICVVFHCFFPRRPEQRRSLKVRFADHSIGKSAGTFVAG